MIFGDENARTLTSEEIGSKEKKKKPVNLQKNVATGEEKQETGFTDPEVSHLGGIQSSKIVLNSGHKTEHKSAESQKSKEKTLNSSPQIEQKSMEKLKEKSSKRKKVFTARKGSALEFVRKIRKELVTIPSLAWKTREDEISEIGVSLQQRVSDITRPISANGNKNCF